MSFVATRITKSIFFHFISLFYTRIYKPGTLAQDPEVFLLRICQSNTFLICRQMKLHFANSGHAVTKAVVCECGKLFLCGTAGAYYLHRLLFIILHFACTRILSDQASSAVCLQ
jgi:hypothetical protein